MRPARFPISIQALAMVAALQAGAGPAAAETLMDALAAAYQTNPTLASQRASLRSVDELLPQAKANWWRPTVTLGAEEGRQWISQEDTDKAGGASVSKNITTNTTLRALGYNLSLPLYRGGRTAAEIKQARAEIAASQAQLEATEQTIFSEVIAAYGNVVLYRALIDLYAENVRDLTKLVAEMENLYAARRRTLIDLSLVRDSLAQARAWLATAIGERRAAESAYQTLVGRPPGKLKRWPDLPGLEGTRDDALARAQARNPQLAAKRSQITAGEANVRAYEGQLLPEVSLFHSFTHEFDKAHYTGNAVPYDVIDNEDTWEIGVTVTVPLYQGGSYYSKVRQSKQDLSRSRSDFAQTSRAIDNAVAAAWDKLAAARQAVRYYRERVAAAQTAEEGISFQVKRGSATMQDFLQVRDRRLSAVYALESSQNDVLTESATLLQAAGQLTAKGLGLDVKLYDPTVHLHDVEDKLIGLGD